MGYNPLMMGTLGYSLFTGSLHQFFAAFLPSTQQLEFSRRGAGRLV